MMMRTSSSSLLAQHPPQDNRAGLRKRWVHEQKSFVHICGICKREGGGRTGNPEKKGLSAFRNLYRRSFLVIPWQDPIIHFWKREEVVHIRCCY